MVNWVLLPARCIVAGLMLISLAAKCDEQPTPEASAAPKFDVWEYRVEGNSVLDNTRIEKAVYPFLGPGKAINDVEQARQALEVAYHDAGYQTVLVNIPEQDVEGGVVVLEVTEGQVERLRVTGSQYHSLKNIREKVPALAQGKVPHLPEVQAQLAKLGEESQDRQVTPVLRAGKTPGKLEVELKVQDELPLHGSVEINSYNVSNTTRTRLLGSIRYDNLWQLHHSASLQYQVSPENTEEVEVWSGTYALPTGFEDTRFVFYGIGIASNTNIASAGALSVIGTGDIFGARLVKPLEPSGGFFQSLLFGFDYKSFDQSVNLVGADTQNTPITYTPFTIGYDGSYRGKDFLSALRLNLNFSVRGLGNEQQEFEDKRIFSRANYVYLTGEFRHRHELPFGLQFAGRFSGQVTDSPLISNEQFSAGGPTSVRGYHQTEALGDHGVMGSVEFISPPLAPAAWKFMNELRALAFFDAAKLWIVKSLPGTASQYQLASAGAGLRLQVWRHFTGELDWAYPLAEANTVDNGEQRVDFRVAYEF
jgi:hemolysin activation/secretion protein